jgi:hypothetical protein
MYLPRTSFKENFIGDLTSVDTADSHIQDKEVNIFKLTETGSQEYS